MTVFSTLWGDKYDLWMPAWVDAVEAFVPDDAVVATDRRRPLPAWVRQVITQPRCVWPKTWYVNCAVQTCETDWVWQCDIDDRLRPDARALLDNADCDVLVVGYERSDGGVTIPRPRTNDAIVAQRFNSIPAGSPVWRHVWDTVQFPDIAHSDWGFWRLCARAGFRFGWAGKVAYDYMVHPEESLTGALESTAATAEALAL